MFIYFIWDYITPISFTLTTYVFQKLFVELYFVNIFNYVYIVFLNLQYI